MLVDCPDCARAYHITADEIGGDGRVVICPRCRARWFQQSERSAGRVAANDDSWLSMTPLASDHRLPALPTSTAPGRRRLLAAMGIALVATATVAGAQARASIVRLVPRTAALYAAVGWPVNVRGLEFVKVAPVFSAAADTRIAGEIRNVAHRRVRVPRITFEIRDGTGASLVSWSELPPAGTLAGGRALTFASAPHHLPAGSRSVVVRFEDADAPGLARKAP